MMKGTCDFCGKEKEVHLALVIAKEKINNTSTPEATARHGLVATLWRCGQCRFLQIVGNAFFLTMVGMIIVVWVVVYFGLLAALPLLLTTLASHYPPIKKFLDEKCSSKKLIDVLEEKNTPGITLSMRMDQGVVIKNDTIKLFALLFAVFLFPAIIGMTLQGINNSKMAESLSKNKRLGVGYLYHNADSLWYESKGKLYYLTLHLAINKSGQMDTVYVYNDVYSSYISDSCNFGMEYNFSDSILKKVLSTVVCIPIVYDATNKLNGKILITKRDFDRAGYTKESVKNQLGIDTNTWKGYDSLSFLFDEFQIKGRCALIEDLKNGNK